MKGCICHFTKWQIHPFGSEGTIYTANVINIVFCPRHVSTDRDVYVYHTRERELMEYDVRNNQTKVILDNSTYVSRPFPANTICWFNAGPPSTTPGQHLTNIGSTYRACLDHNLVSVHVYSTFLIVLQRENLKYT